MIEKREHKRVKIQGKAFAVLQPHYTKMGRIIDISRDGFSFRYLFGHLNRPPRLKKRNFEQYLLFTYDGNILDHVPAMVISDIKIEDSKTPMRRRSLQFLELSQEQAYSLDYFTQYLRPFQTSKEDEKEIIYGK